MKKPYRFKPMAPEIARVVLAHRISNEELHQMATELIALERERAQSDKQFGPVLLSGDTVLSVLAELTWYRSLEDDVAEAERFIRAGREVLAREVLES